MTNGISNKSIIYKAKESKEIQEDLNKLSKLNKPLADNLCDSCTNIGCEFQSGIVRTECVFYMPPHMEPDNCGNYLEVREFEEIVVEYPHEDLCTYPEYKGKPYFGIKYKENGEEIVGYGTYKPEVLSRYLKDYFMPNPIRKKASGAGMKKIETVKDLIEELQKLPADAYISFCDYDGDFEAEIRWDITPEEYEKGYEDQPYIYLTRPRTWS